MVGIIILGHAKMSFGLLEAAKEIMAIKPGVVAIPYRSQGNISEFEARIKHEIANIDEGEGVLVLTDIYGATPTNVVLKFINEMHIEVVTGVNLPMVLEAITHRETLGLPHLAMKVEQRSKACIVNAGEYFRCHHVAK
ncbi:MAG TPA: PTS sugar transporter subunit IIA [bacterium]|nr:PTS sugar transporter subunit IIA [bacterium]